MGIQSGAIQPGQRNTQPCTQTTDRVPGPSDCVDWQVAATLISRSMWLDVLLKVGEFVDSAIRKSPIEMRAPPGAAISIIVELSF